PTRLVAELRVLAKRREIAQRFQAERFEKAARRAVQHRASRLVLFADDADEIALEQALQDGPRIHATHVVDFGPGDRLPVGDDGERFELSSGEAYRPERQILANALGVFRARAK